MPDPPVSQSGTWRQDPDIGLQAIKVAQALCQLAREYVGTFTFDYAGYQRVVVRRGDHGISAQFVTSKPERSTASPGLEEPPDA